MTRPIEDETRTFERTFTIDDVRRFADLSGDDQVRHTEPDEDGQVMVQGLLTATLPAKMGSDDNVLASTNEFDFRRPVYTGNPITCRATYDTVTERDNRYEFTKEFVCENANGEIVLTETTKGLVWKDD